MNRRQLLQAAWLLPLVPEIPGFTGARGIVAVHDPAYSHSRDFAALLEERGARAAALHPDALALWHGHLRAVLLAGTATRIAGLTTYTDFLVMHDLARGAGLATMWMRRPVAGTARATLVPWMLGFPDLPDFFRLSSQLPPQALKVSQLW